MGDRYSRIISGIYLHVQMLGLVIFLKQGNVLQLRVTANMYVFGIRQIVKWSAAD